MTRYAARTTVSVSASIAEVEGLIARFGAQRFAYSWDEDQDVVAFEANGHPVKIAIPRPGPPDFMRQQEREQERRRKWRVMVLTIKALLVAVEEEVLSFEDAFLAHLILDTGETIGQAMRPRLEAAQRSRVLSLPEARDVR